MAENISCSIDFKKLKEKKLENEKKYNYTYDENLAEYFAASVGAKPRGRETESELDENGAFVRQANYFIEPITKEQAEKYKYRVYWSPGCNWSNRPVIAKEILGLDDVITDYKVSHTPSKYGWGFPEEKDFKDPITGVYFLSQFYLNADKDYTGRATTPTLVNTDLKVAANNDYHRLTNHIEVAFRGLQPKDAPDLYPVKYRKEIDELNDWLFPHVNNGHYRQAFTSNPLVYEESQKDFHAALEKLDKRLETNRFLFGDYITDSDIRAYVSLVKWETDFYVNVGPQIKRIREYKNIWGYIKDLYQIPAFKNHTNLPKEGNLNLGVFNRYLDRLAKSNWDEFFKVDDSRKKLSADPENVFLKHPEGETVEDYIKPISVSKWNNKDPKVRGDWNFQLSVDPSINPLKGLLKNN
ncbi:MAG: glutathione S-transferase C-terminal domain-containing protein [Acholeplasmatales bacterium]|nr:glutathione S-transferase C-terminal domain-containing protein [Acholeplasmatales bacterium]